MSSNNSLLILSAGRGIGLDGFHKLNLVSPSSGETVLERYRRQLGDDTTIVVGYRAPELMSQYPNLEFVYNYNWFETGSAFSAGLVLKSCPVIVVPSDLFLDDAAAEVIATASGNVVFTCETENRPKNAINVATKDGAISEIYSGPKRNGTDAEFKGVVRIEDDKVLEAIVRDCEANPSLAFSDVLSMHKEVFKVKDSVGRVVEINFVEEYVEFFQADRANAKA